MGLPRIYARHLCQFERQSGGCNSARSRGLHWMGNVYVGDGVANSIRHSKIQVPRSLFSPLPPPLILLLLSFPLPHTFPLPCLYTFYCLPFPSLCLSSLPLYLLFPCPGIFPILYHCPYCVPGAIHLMEPVSLLRVAGEEMNFNPENPQWPNRDRFVLSSGHGCTMGAIIGGSIHM